ncbi:MAG: HlyD family efflux transporter periplasmic adaptor subunit [Pseudomonadota bacterium]
MSATDQLLREHSAEGIDVLLSEPAAILRVFNLLLAAGLLAAVAWACYARVDVVVSAPGSLVPEQDLRRVYTPVDGELVEVYASEGAPVEAGDIVARVKARGAIDAASKLVEARLQLADAQLEYRSFPAQKTLLQQRASVLQQRYDFLSQAYEKQLADGRFRLAQAQRARLVEAQAAVEQAQRQAQAAETEAEQFERLSRSEGGGGVSRTQVESKLNARLDAQDALRTARAQLAALEYELNNSLTQADKALASAAEEVSEAKIELETLLAKIERDSARVEVRYRSAKAAAEAARELSFENFDENNNLKIYAPISGTVTQIPLQQPGDKLRASEPLLSIAPADSRKVLRVHIAEKDRGFIAVGLSVKVKFSAFPYQTYGLIEGQLDYISPTVVPAGEGAPPAYDGKVLLSATTVETANGPAGLRYGMNATAEIVVRKRRVIDLAIDPLRRFN